MPTVDAELDPEPAAEPPVPTLDELLPPPADEPPVPSVEAEPLPEPLPAAEPPVPTVELLVPPPAAEPPVPSVDAEPEPVFDPAEEPPVPMVELLVPPPAEEPPVPTVELDCATAKAVLANRAAAAADNFKILISVSSSFFKESPKQARDKLATVRTFLRSKDRIDVPRAQFCAHAQWTDIAAFIHLPFMRTSSRASRDGDSIAAMRVVVSNTIFSGNVRADRMRMMFSVDIIGGRTGGERRAASPRPAAWLT